MPTRDVVLEIEGMTCASCVQKIERALDRVEGVDAAAINLATRRATVSGELDDISPLLRAVSAAGYGARAVEAGDVAGSDRSVYLWRLKVAVPLAFATLVVTFGLPDFSWGPQLAWALATPVVFWCGWPFLRSAARAARHGTTTMDTLISLGALAAYSISVWAVLKGDPEHYFDTASVIVTLILVGKVLEARARAAAGDAARALLERGAKAATVQEADGSERSIPIEELGPGMRAVVRPGEKIPSDGVVKEGMSWVDLSILTGESVPIDVGPGDEVVGGSVNGPRRIVMFVTTVGRSTKLAEIVRLLEAAQGSKAPIQRLADRISAVFVPVTLVVASLTLAGWLWFTDVDAGTALLHAVAVLVIACPCALGLATPAAITAGAGRAAELGVLFRGGEVFETARAVDVVLFDKTGTVTEGAMTLARTLAFNGATEHEVLGWAAATERGSEHPIARAVTDGARRLGVPDLVATEHAAQPGAGATALVEGTLVRVGRPAGLPPAATELADRLASEGLTPFGVWRDDVPQGLVAVADTIKPDVAEAVATLDRMGIDVSLVTGDREGTAASVAAQAGIGRVLAEVLPAGKVEEVRRLRAEGQVVAFVGDGLNDAPALSSADVGIAMGTGTDVAIAAADVQVLGGSIGSVAIALDLSRHTYRVIQENLFWAFAYNVVMIPLAVLGVLNPMWAAAAMAASSVTVVANALRLRRFGRGHGNIDLDADVASREPVDKIR